MKSESSTRRVPKVDSSLDDSAARRRKNPPRIRTAIAVIVMRFPRIDETFILREITELERHGQPVLVVPLLPGGESVVHDEAKSWVKRALYTPLLSALILRSNLKVFLKMPLAYLALLFRLIARTIIRPSTMMRTLALFPKSVYLSLVLKRLGIRHVHAHFASHATTVAYIIASLSNITYSFSVHGPDVFVHRVLLREKMANAKFIRAISLFNKAFLCGLYPTLTEGKIHVVHSGVNPEVYEEAAQTENDAGPASARPLRLLSIAALIPSRGFPFLIEACARLAMEGLDFECDIVGDGPLRAATEATIAKNGLTGRVRILGSQPQHEVARLMGAADIFVLPSIIAMNGQMDGIPISLMEAMAAGKPVIASSLSGIPELVQHRVSGLLVDSAYAGRLAEAVQVLAADAGLRERLGRAGQMRVRREFDAHRTAAQLVALFDGQKRVNEVQQTIAERVRSLKWDRLDAKAVGVRKVEQRSDAFVAEVQISDGVERKDVIVRRPRGEEASERLRTEFEVLSTLRETMGAEAKYTVPRLLMFDEAHASLVLERADGRALASSLRESTMREAGTWLRTMQNFTRSDDDGRYVLTAVMFLAQRDLDLAAAADRFVRRNRQALLERMHELEARVATKPMPVVGQHGNFRPENIYIGEQRVSVTDFGAYREGLPAEDVAHLFLFVDRDELRRAFFEGYGAGLDADTLRLFTITKALAAFARSGATPAERRKLRRVIGRV